MKPRRTQEFKRISRRNKERNLSKLLMVEGYRGGKENDLIVVDDKVDDTRVGNNGNKDKNIELVEKLASGSKSDDLVQNNRFDALLRTENVTIRTEMIAYDNQLEDETNEELEQKRNEDQSSLQADSENSNDSEFVDATQHHEDSNVSSSQEQDKEDVQDVGLTLVDLEKENRLFLEQSWANIADGADAEQRLLQDLEKHDELNQGTSTDDFKVVQR